MERTVTVRVWDRSYEINVYQRFKTVWIAVGDYMGDCIEVKVSTKGAAIKLWQDTARFKGN